MEKIERWLQSSASGVGNTVDPLHEESGGLYKARAHNEGLVMRSKCVRIFPRIVTGWRQLLSN